MEGRDEESLLNSEIVDSFEGSVGRVTLCTESFALLDEFDVVVDEVLIDFDVLVVGFEDPVLNESEAGEAFGVRETRGVSRSRHDVDVVDCRMVNPHGLRP